MEDSEFNYSLCEACLVNDRVMLCRVADYSPATTSFSNASYTDRFDTNYKVFEPVLIGANPVEQFEVNKLYMRKWVATEDDDRKQYSYPYKDVVAIEVVIDAKLSRCKRDSEVVACLQNGIRIPKYINDDFLLVIKKGESSHRAILCNKRDFEKSGMEYRISQKVDDMLHTTHKFPIVDIKIREYVSSSGMLKQMAFETNPRYFYKFAELPKISDYFVPRTSKSYIQAYLKWYCKKIKESQRYSKKTTDEFFALLNNAEQSEEDLAMFFKNTPFGISEVREELGECSELVKSFLSDEPEAEYVMRKILADDQALFEKAQKSIEADWLTEQSTLKDEVASAYEALLNEKHRVQRDLDLLKSEKSKVLSDIKSSKKDLEKLDKQMKSEEEKLKLIEASSKDCLAELKNNMIGTLRDVGLYSLLAENTGAVNCDQGNRSYKHQIESGTIEEVEPSANIVEFVEDYVDNLSKFFMEPYDIACAVVSVLLGGRSILIENQLCCSVAMAFSMLIEGKAPECLFVGDSQISLAALIEDVQSCQTKTVVIMGLFDSYNEVAISALCRVCSEKYLFFGVGGKEKISLMSQSVYSQVVFLDVEDFNMISSGSKPLIASNNQLPLLVSDPDEKSQQVAYANYMSDFVKDGRIGNVLANSMAIIISYYNLISFSNMNDSVILRSLNYVLKDKGKTDE